MLSWTLKQWSGRFLGIITGWDPSVWKSNWLHADIYDRGEPVKLQMNRLSLRNNRLKFKTAGRLPIILQESIEYIHFNKGKLEDVDI